MWLYRVVFCLNGNNCCLAAIFLSFYVSTLLLQSERVNVILYDMYLSVQLFLFLVTLIFAYGGFVLHGWIDNLSEIVSKFLCFWKTILRKWWLYLCSSLQ